MHAEDRHHFYQALQEAERTAVEAGSIEDGSSRPGYVNFATFLHLIRSYLQIFKQKQMQREEAALRQLALTKSTGLRVSNGFP